MLARSMYVAYQVLFVKCIKVACMCEKLCFVFLCVKAMLSCTYTPVPGIPGSMYRYCILRLDVITHETGRDRTDFALFAAEKDQGGAGWNGHSGTVEVGGVYPSYNAGRSPTHMHHHTIEYFVLATHLGQITIKIIDPPCMIQICQAGQMMYA